MQRLTGSIRRLIGPAGHADELVAVTPDTFDEQGYLDANPDVAEAVANGSFGSGRHHYAVFGRHEPRLQRPPRRRVVPPEPVARLAGRARRAWSARRSPDAELEAELRDLRIECRQLHDLIELLGGNGPPPPKHLQVRVVGDYQEGFVRGGFTSVIPQLDRALAAADRRIDDFTSILDFGCGCGRSIFAVARTVPDADLHGADIDAEAIAWLREHHPDLATYEVCPSMPPMPYDDDTFDLVFGISVLTHLPEDMQFAWLEELARVTAPGGYVILTTHGEHHYLSLSAEERATLDEHGFLYRRCGYGESIDLPEFYETAYHSHDYIRRTWSRHFEVVDVRPPAPGEHQDVALLRVPG